uniref:Uncharacterized protein n=1 Tax=Chenopodium quinoa TaxID=63459 RepID=A0A803MUH1_CHEQI
MEGECETEGSDNLEDNNDDCPDSLSRSRVNINEADNSITEYRVLNSTTEVNKRGPTMMHKVHMRPFENREAIILNEFGQPIGPVTPEKDTPGEFSRFLGTIARDYGYVPLIYNSWHYVSNKEKMWEYVLTKYIVLEESKDWVLKTMGAAWRIHKCRFKKKYLYKDKDNKTKWNNRPKRVPDDDFKLLLVLWNKKKSSGIKDAYLAVMGKEYVGRRRLYGKGVSNKVLNNTSPSVASYVVPGEVIDSLRAEVIEIEKLQLVDMRKKLEKEYEKRKTELEAKHAKKMEEFGKQKETMVDEILEKLMSKQQPSVVKQFLT